MNDKLNLTHSLMMKNIELGLQQAKALQQQHRPESKPYYIQDIEVKLETIHHKLNLMLEKLEQS